jgi:hypothetical protein
VFTARYALSPYIKQMSFVFKGLIMLIKYCTYGLPLPVCAAFCLSVLFLTSVQSVHGDTGGCYKGLWNIGNPHPFPPSLCCMVTLFALHFPGEMGTRYVWWWERGGRGGVLSLQKYTTKGVLTHTHAALCFLNNPPGSTNSQTCCCCCCCCFSPCCHVQQQPVLGSNPDIGWRLQMWGHSLWLPAVFGI